MSEKRLDRCGRWRNVIVAFRVSKEEGEAIDEAVALSGHSKQDYIISKLLNRGAGGRQHHGLHGMRRLRICLPGPDASDPHVQDRQAAAQG